MPSDPKTAGDWTTCADPECGEWKTCTKAHACLSATPPPAKTAVMVGDWRIVAVHMNGATKNWLGFESSKAAMDWAIANRTTLGLNRCARWYVEASNE